jgi:hypothetical protein
MRLAAFELSSTGPAAAMCRLALVALLAVSCNAGPLGPDMSKARAQASVALDHWAAAIASLGSAPLVVPVGDLTGQIGDWEANVGDNNKRALLAGWISTLAELAGPAQDANVTWADGSTTTVHILSAQDAIVAIERASQTTCEDCTDLTATSASLVSGEIQTARGPATAPIWSFAIAGTAVRVTRVAIASSVSVSQLPWDPSFASVGLHVDSATGAATGTDVTVSFIGAPDPGSKPCGEDYTVEVAESDLAIVVIVVRHPAGMAFGGCSAVGARRTATAHLQDPLGARAILNVDDGQPVATTITP